ncbi:hypothetical protein LINPERHAP1_LOCUS13107 [Linum perenne]
MQEDVNSNPRCPRITFTEQEVRSFYEPWSKALAVRVLKKSFSFLTMKRRLEILWARSGTIQMCDLANNFFLVSFSEAIDYKRAGFDGPWKIYDYYITVAQWTPLSMKRNRFKRSSRGFGCPDFPYTTLTEWQ